MAATEHIGVKMDADVAGAVNGIKQVNAELNKMPAATSKAGTAVNKSTKDFTNFGRVIQDLPFGIQGIQNNLTQLIPAAGAAGLAFTGIVTALTFAQVGFGAWTRGLNLSSKGLNVLKESIEAASKAMGEDLVRLEVYKNKLNDVNIPASERVKIIREYNKVADENNKIDEKQVNNLTLINSKIEQQNTLILKRALAVAAMGKITEKVNELIEDEIRLQEQLSKKGFKDIDDFEKKHAEEMKKKAAAAAKSLQNMKKPANDLGAPMQIVRKGLDGIVTPANNAALAVSNSEDALFSLLGTVKKGREDLQKFIGNLGGLLTVDGLTTKDDKSGIKGKLKKEIDIIRAEFTSLVGRDKPVGELFFRIKLAEAQADKSPAESISQKLTKELLPKKIEPRVNVAPKVNFEIDEALVNALEFRDQLNDVLAKSFSSGFNTIGESIGAAIASGADPIKAAGESILGSIGDLISQIGKALIQYGVVKTGLDKILIAGIVIPGAAAIAAGIAAVALGQLVKTSFKPKGFATGGVIPAGFPNDTYYARLTSGERVLTPSQNKEWERGAMGRANMGRDVFIPELVIDYNKLAIAFNRMNKYGGLTG